MYHSVKTEAFFKLDQNSCSKKKLESNVGINLYSMAIRKMDEVKIIRNCKSQMGIHAIYFCDFEYTQK